MGRLSRRGEPFGPMTPPRQPRLRMAPAATHLPVATLRAPCTTTAGSLHRCSLTWEPKPRTPLPLASLSPYLRAGGGGAA
jgi:hypothetical protein